MPYQKRINIIIIIRLPLVSRVPEEEEYALPEEASSEEIYELISTLPLPSRCKTHQVFPQEFFWKSPISKLISAENLWQLGVQPREQGGNRTDREGGEGEEGGKENLLSRKEFLTLPRKRGKASPL